MAIEPERIEFTRSSREAVTASRSQEGQAEYAQAMIQEYREPIKRITEWTVLTLSSYDAVIHELDRDQTHANPQLPDYNPQDCPEEDLHESPARYAYDHGLNEELGENIWQDISAYSLRNHQPNQPYNTDETAYRRLVAWNYFKRVMNLVAIRNGALVEQIGHIKSDANLEVRNAEQERRVFDACREQAEIEGLSDDFPDFAESIMEKIVADARRVQTDIKSQKNQP